LAELFEQQVDRLVRLVVGQIGRQSLQRLGERLKRASVVCLADLFEQRLERLEPPLCCWEAGRRRETVLRIPCV
jgi:hypothetical protein